MGTRTELSELLRFMANAGIKPHIDKHLRARRCAQGFREDE